VQRQVEMSGITRTGKENDLPEAAPVLPVSLQAPRLPEPDFISVGFGGQVAMNRVLALLSPDTAPVRRLIQEARDKGLLIDATYGRKTKAALVLDTGHILIAALTPETITGRYQQKQSK
jgi:regulator of extracellular matrix RemA (YlzA/DUF370 family)